MSSQNYGVEPGANSGSAKDPLLISNATLTFKSIDGGADNDLKNEKVSITPKVNTIQMKQTEEEQDECKIHVMLISL